MNSTSYDFDNPLHFERTRTRRSLRHMHKSFNIIVSFSFYKFFVSVEMQNFELGTIVRWLRRSESNLATCNNKIQPKQLHQMNFSIFRCIEEVHEYTRNANMKHIKSLNNQYKIINMYERFFQPYLSLVANANGVDRCLLLT